MSTQGKKDPFPDPLKSKSPDLVFVGADLKPETLLFAYAKGIFPWPMEHLPLTWFCPDPRAILEFADLKPGKRLERQFKNCPYTFTADQAFDQVIHECAMISRPGQDGTWITADLEEAYNLLHQQGAAHSIEVWDGSELIGGIYGVLVPGLFSAESMFYKKPNASKLALLHLTQWLQGEYQLSWMDIQMMTPHMKKMGAKEISRREFLKKLKEVSS